MKTYPSPAVPVSIAQDNMGVNAPLLHQQIIAHLTMELGILYHKTKVIAFEPLPETMLAEGYGNPVPDLLLYDHQAEQTRLIIEICQTNGQNNDLRKIIRLIDEADYGISEGFVFNYKTHQWFRYSKGEGSLVSNTAYSVLLDLDLSKLLDNPAA